MCKQLQVYNENSFISRDTDSIKQIGLIDCFAFEKQISVSPSCLVVFSTRDSYANKTYLVTH